MAVVVAIMILIIKNNIMKFDELDWHDAILQNIQIDRNNPGEVDTIVLTIVWPDDTKSKIVFNDVYWANLTLNFGIVASESIDSASELIDVEDDMDMRNLIQKWRGVVQDSLMMYVFRTASTGSEIKIIAKGFVINVE